MANIVVQKLKAGAKVIDVRTREEFLDGAYSGAVNMPVNELHLHAESLSKTEPVVLYCASGARSAAAAQLLRRLGFTDVVNAGGLADMPVL